MSNQLQTGKAPNKQILFVSLEQCCCQVQHRKQYLLYKILWFSNLVQCSVYRSSTRQYRQYSTEQCSTVQYSAVQYNAVQCSAVQCNAVRCSEVPCSAVQCSVVQCSAV